MPRKKKPNQPSIKEIKTFLLEKYNIQNPKHLDFFIEYIQNPVGSTAYNKVYGPHTTGVASVLASRIKDKYNVSFSEWLSYSGHGEAQIAEALEALRLKSPDKYLKHVTALHGLDIKKVEHSGTIDIPTIMVTDEKVND